MRRLKSLLQRHESAEALWLLAEKLVLLCLNLGFSVALARTLGQSDFALFYYLLSFLLFSTPVYSMGMARILVRELAVAPGQAASLLYSAALTRLIFSGVVCLFSCIGLGFILQFSQQWFYICLLLFANLSYAANVYEFWLQYQHKNGLLVQVRFAILLLFVGLKLALLYWLQSLPWLIALHALEVVITNFAYYILYVVSRKNTSDITAVVSFDWPRIRSLLQQSLYLLLSGIAVVLYLRMDLVMLQHLSTIEQTAIYAAAMRISETWYSVPAILLLVMAPTLLKLHLHNAADYQRKLQWVFVLLFFSSLLFCLALYGVAPRLMPWLYGESFVLAAVVLQWHLWAGIFVSLREGLSHWLVAERFAGFSLFSHLFGAFVNLIANYYWIPVYGAVGAAWATVLAFACSTFVCLLFLKRTRTIAWMMLKAPFVPLLYLLQQRNKTP